MLVHFKSFNNLEAGTSIIKNGSPSTVQKMWSFFMNYKIPARK